MSERITAMKQFVDNDPDNPFPRYALAMELKGQGQLKEASEALKELVERKPEYVPSYLMLGMLLDDLGEEEEAKAVYADGIVRAKAAGNAHAQSELQSALDELS